MREAAFWRGGSVPRLEPLEPRLLLAADIVINEIHYDPDVKTERAEFIELYNPGAAAVNLSGWYLSDGIDFVFPQGSSVASNCYLVVAQDPATIWTKWRVSALGPWTGLLADQGERIVLRDAAGAKVDEVNYRLGFPWPTVGEPPGYSIELINPALDNDLGGSWRSHGQATPGQDGTLIAAGSVWHYRKGTSEASAMTGAWRQIGFVEDGSWTTGQAAVGYGEDFIKTRLADMQTGYASIYLRQTFTIADPSQIASLRLEAQYDDGFNAWINGQRVAWASVAREDMAFNEWSTGVRENYNFDVFNCPSPAGYLVQGTNVLAVQLHNCSTASSDAFWDCRLIGSSGSTGAGPTPGARNAVYSPNAPPQLRQVEHSPQEPASNQPVTVTVKATDPDGVASVSLQYQLVEPGNYIEVADAAYQTNWTTVAMNDAGTGGDAVAGDDVYTATLPASLQVNRRLVRYRIAAADALGKSITVPYADDPQPNFAYFVYDGVPGWSGAIDPNSSDPAKRQVVAYGTDVMRSVPAYHLIAKKGSVEHATWIDQYWGDAYPWSGTLVYDGQVYDNIHFRARGGCWRYAMGKNMWKFDFNRGHSFQAKDDYGQPYDTTWSKLNLGACIQQGDYWHRGEQGMFESVGFRLFNLAGSPASETNFVEFRVIDDASQAGADQYGGDFWGLYLAVEQVDGRFLDEHDLPDGNLYKMESGPGGGELNNQGPWPCVTDNSDLINFTGTYTSTTPADQWWRDNLDLESYYSYRSIVEGIRHGDIGYGKNYVYYLNPETNRWTVIPWDLDLTWSDNMYGDGNEPFKSRVLPRAAFGTEYRNRLREIRDLLFNTDQTYQLIDEMASFIHEPTGYSIVDADRAMWDYNPIMISGYVNQSKAGQGRFYQGGGGIVIPPPGGFMGMVQKMKNYVVTRAAYIDSSLLTDSASIPYTPTLVYTGAAGYPLSGLTFRSSSFSSPSGSPFAAIEWRIAEVTDPASPHYNPAAPKYYEITAAWQSPELTTFNAYAAIPSEAVVAHHTYRVRVRMKDAAGRWSHWSAPIRFEAGPPSYQPPAALRVVELMYHPRDPTPGTPEGGYDASDFQYVELQNTSAASSIFLAGAKVSAGVTFTFPNIAVAPGQRLLIVKSAEAFRARYGTGLDGMIVGQFTGSLDPGGEQIVLECTQTGCIQDFTYSDGWFPWTDGEGHSLTVRDPAQALGLWSEKGGWRPSHLLGGSPGAGDADYSPGAIVINEVLAHQDTEPPGDYIELKNTTDAEIDISGWYLSDDPDTPMKYQIASGTKIPAHGFQVFTESANFGLGSGDPGCLVPFGFSELGEWAYLVSVTPQGALAGYRELEDFGASDREVPFGRYTKSTGGTDFVAMSEKSAGSENPYPLVGPIVINEIMYRPAAAGNYEYVELRNLSAIDVPLYEPDHPGHPVNLWKITNAVSFTFPASALIPADGYALVVPTSEAAFRAKYPAIPTSVRIFGPYAGMLSDTGATVDLKKPGEPQPDDSVPYLRVDRVTYGISSPWPPQANGTGPSLERMTGQHYGNDVANWRCGPPGGTPGAANAATLALPAVVSVCLNGNADRGPSGIDPSGRGVATVTVGFSKPVTFAAGDVLVQAVTFPGGAEMLGPTLSAAATGSGTDTMTITLATPVVDGWVKVTLASAGTLKDLQGNPLDGAARPGGSGRRYIYNASLDLPTGNGVAGREAVFYVGSLRGDFAAPPGEESVHRITQEDLDGFLGAFAARSPDADFRGAGFGAGPPDGQVTSSDIDGFLAVYNAAIATGWHLDPLPNPGPLSAGQPQPVTPSRPDSETLSGASAQPCVIALAASVDLGGATPEGFRDTNLPGAEAPSGGDVLVAASIAGDGSSVETSPASGLDTIPPDVPLAWRSAPPESSDGADPVLASDGGAVDLLALPALVVPPDA